MQNALKYICWDVMDSWGIMNADYIRNSKK